MNPTASKQQMLRLFDKLANDDLFRSRFERNPKSALVEAGFTAEGVATFPVEQLSPGTLAAKGVFAAEYERVANDLAEQCLCMVIPSPMLCSRGKSGGSTRVDSTLSRAA